MYSHLFDLPSWWVVFVSTLASQLPEFLMELAGMLVAVWFWRRAPRPALLVLVACSLMFVATLFGTWVIGWWLPSVQSNSSVSNEVIMRVMSLWSFAGQLIHGIAIGVLIWAAFSGRARSVSAP